MIEDNPTDSKKSYERKPRLNCVDALRGLVMVFMCLDHSREFFGDLRVQPENLDTTSPLLFGTRWITHFCAPTFIFLSGVSAWLYQQKVESRRKLSHFLWTRGLWLIVLEFTVVYFGWFFSIGPFPLMFIVIAAIGFCMIALAGLIWLPFRFLAVIGVLIVLLHNALDPIKSEDLGQFSWLWKLLHDGGRIESLYMDIGYPVLAWIGVIICGYCFGPVLQMPVKQRRAFCLRLGIGCVVAFLLLRTLNWYGDPDPRVAHGDWATVIMSFLRCTKYPPSLLYLLMTLGPALIVLATLDLDSNPNPASSTLTSILTVYGRVPLFFYVAHLYLIHVSAMLVYWLIHGKAISPVATAFRFFMEEADLPEEYGLPLWGVYPAWITMLLILWPLCFWYGKLKRRGRHAIWSYL